VIIFFITLGDGEEKEEEIKREREEKRRGIMEIKLEKKDGSNNS
jgi:hypothetical protein